MVNIVTTMLLRVQGNESENGDRLLVTRNFSQQESCFMFIFTSSKLIHVVDKALLNSTRIDPDVTHMMRLMICVITLESSGN